MSTEDTERTSGIDKPDDAGDFGGGGVGVEEDTAAPNTAHDVV